MRLKTYHAFSMAEALAAVKQDLGPSAVILHTRTFKRGGIFGFFQRTIVEVTATPAPPQSKPATPPRRLRLKDVQAQRAYATTSAVQPPAQKDGDRERTRRLALALEESHRRKKAEVGAGKTADVEPKVAPSNAPPPAARVEKTARRFILTAPDALDVTRTVDRVETKPHVIEQSPASPISAVNPVMADELSAIKQMVGQVLQRQKSANSDSGLSPDAMPRQLFDHYLKLISQDLSDEIAQQIVRDVRSELREEDLEDEARVRAAVLKHLAAFIPASADSFPTRHDGRPFIIALVGPTGVGKTTTLAKLAATFKLRQGRNVGLITADTYRIAAVDQLRTYADIIDLPLQVALTPAEMKRAVDAFADRDVILIDTAGRSQRDNGRLAELKRFIAAANPNEVHLVLSSTAGEKVLLQEAEAFSRVGLHKLILTKLDEAVSFGMLINAVRQIGTQLSFITTGQEVPDHLEVGRGERLAELVMGGKLETEMLVH